MPDFAACQDYDELVRVVDSVANDERVHVLSETDFGVILGRAEALLVENRAEIDGSSGTVFYDDGSFTPWKSAESFLVNLVGAVTFVPEDNSSLEMAVERFREGCNDLKSRHVLKRSFHE